MLRDLDTVTPAPLLHYTCFRCGTRQRIGHRCGPDAPVPASRLAWLHGALWLVGIGATVYGVLCLATWALQVLR